MKEQKSKDLQRSDNTAGDSNVKQSFKDRTYTPNSSRTNSYYDSYQGENYSQNKAQIISTTSIGQGRNLHVVKMGDSAFLIGATQNNIAYIKDEIDEYLDKTFNKTGNLFLAGIEALFEFCENDLAEKNKAIIQRYEIYEEIECSKNKT